MAQKSDVICIYCDGRFSSRDKQVLYKQSVRRYCYVRSRSKQKETLFNRFWGLGLVFGTGCQQASALMAGRHRHQLIFVPSQHNDSAGAAGERQPNLPFPFPSRLCSSSTSFFSFRLAVHVVVMASHPSTEEAATQKVRSLKEEGGWGGWVILSSHCPFTIHCPQARGTYAFDCHQWPSIT